ncbi:MAG: hypothetical protein K2Y29_13820 [Beijerinckiaceae bacterium]|nr:hypothetical protein [Beijerinckiaceae bacterium]
MSKPLVVCLSVLTALLWLPANADAATKKQPPAKEASAQARSGATKGGAKPAARGTIVKSKSNITNN